MNGLIADPRNPGFLISPDWKWREGKLSGYYQEVEPGKWVSRNPIPVPGQEKSLRLSIGPNWLFAIPVLGIASTVICRLSGN